MSSSLTSAELSKLKVADLKRELKLRDLPSTGNKGELLERLEEALKTEEAEALLEQPADDTEDDVPLDDIPLAATITSKVTPSVQKSSPAKPSVTAAPVKPSAPANAPKNQITTSAPEKAPAVPAVEVTEQVQAPLTAEEKRLSRAERFGIVSDDVAKSKRAQRFGIVSDDEKKAQRAAKFGLSVENTNTASPADDSEKKAKRAERFGVISSEPAGQIKSGEIKEMSEEERQRLLKRKERFGEVTSTLVNQVDSDEKIKQRAARFGAIAAPVITAEDEERKKKRMERFATA